MPQDYSEVLDDRDTVMDYLVSDLEEVDFDKITAYMGRIKLNWDEMNGNIGDLSYGQKAKIILLKMMLDRKNVLLLDEPTRNLSALSNPVIREVLKDFDGCIIGVSHDRKFLKEVCDVIYKLEENGLKRTSIK
jgi:ATPase subunit of ABC transporter with duplicated ATPase domains